MEAQISLEHIIFNLKEEDLEISIQQTMKLYESNLYSFNFIISKLVFYAFYSQGNTYNVYLDYLESLQNLESEINKNGPKLIDIFSLILLKTKDHLQESYYLIERMIERNLIDKNITRNIDFKYFAHYKTEKENKIVLYKGGMEDYFHKNYKKLTRNNFKLHKKYVKEGVNPNEIIKIIRNDEIKKLQEISSQANFDFNQKINPSIYERYSFINRPNISLIDYTAFFGSIKCFKYLLMNGAVAEDTGKYAIAGGNIEIIHLCEQNHSSFDKAYETAIEFHRNNIFYYLYDNKIKKSFNVENLVKICIFYDNYEIFSFLQEKEGIKFDDDIINKIATHGNLFILKYFLENYPVPKNILISSAESENIELVKYLLEQKGIDINYSDKYYRTVKDYCTRYNNEYIKQRTVLHKAIENNNVEFVKLLLEHKGINVNAIYEDYKKVIVETYEAYGYDIDESTDRGTALHFAIRNNNIEFVKLLLEHKGVDINAKYEYIYKCDDIRNHKRYIERKGTALHLAVNDNNIELVKLLLEKGADVVAVYENKEEDYRNKKNIKKDERLTAIQIATAKGNKEMISLLTKKTREL